jgi:hypothetical protein
MSCCIVSLLVFHLNFQIQIQMHLNAFSFLSLFFSPLGPAHLLSPFFLFPTRPSPAWHALSRPFLPQGPAQLAFSFFSSLPAQPNQPNSFFSVAQLSLPSLSCYQAGPVCRARPQARARLRLAPESGRGLASARTAFQARTSRPPRPPYKTAAPRPRYRRTRNDRHLISQTLASAAAFTTAPWPLSPLPPRRSSIAASRRWSSTLG